LRHDYIYFGGKRIARQDDTTGNAVYYFFQDHLGTALVMTDSNGAIQQQSFYYPFGGERVVTNNVDSRYKFTGLERDSESGLDHALNRQYSSTLGRWLSPDPVRGCVMNPQKFDRYSYVLDNAATLTDPSGLQEFGDEEPCNDFFFATTHAECGPPSGPFVNPDMLDIIELRDANAACTLTGRDPYPQWAKNCDALPRDECLKCCSRQHDEQLALCAIEFPPVPIIESFLEACIGCVELQTGNCRWRCPPPQPR
jgi:RHS repeat-associated protein